MTSFQHKLPLPGTSNPVVHWHRLYACAQAQAIAHNLGNRPGLLIVPDIFSAIRLQDELQFFCTHTQVHLFPDWETLAYDVFSPHQDIIADRLKILFNLQNNRNDLYIIAIDTLLQRMPPAAFLQNRTINLHVKDILNREDFRRKLNENAYVAAPQVVTHGEYALRGSILDFFPPGYTHPVRIDCFDDEIESLRTFDPETQKSIEKIASVQILPAREFPLDEQGIIDFRQNFRDIIDSPPEESIIYRDISMGRIPGGIEYYLPLFFSETSSFFEYLPANTIIFSLNDVQSKIEEYWRSIRERYEHLRDNLERPPLSPEHLFLSHKTYQQQCQRFHQVMISDFKDLKKNTSDGRTQVLPSLALQTASQEPAKNFKTWLNKLNCRALIVAETAGYREQLIETLLENKIKLNVTNNWHSFLESEYALCICTGKIDKGVYFENENLAVIADNELFGHKVKQRRRNRPTDTRTLIQNLNELKIGHPVVHEKHGIGRFQGLETIEIAGYPSELLVIDYADGDKLYVPVSALHLISRYTSGNSETAPLHKLGGKQWQKTKSKAAKKAFDAAAELLDIYARRDVSTGINFQINTLEYQSFANAFIYQETPDQSKAIEDTFEQMQEKKPMDHVICGDVGFGKTEIAMRAAFIAVQNGYQVAVIAPTTLLTNQHLQTFRSRFSDWPIRVGLLSRFVSPAQQKKTIQELKDGLLDIVIGTHKLLQKNITFKRLGLMITDEEQRFGVHHKEQLKSWYPNVDMLTLSATPLPRTLNITLSGLRTLSIIATPPPHRYAVKTYVSDWSDQLISEACHRELHRGGQVYFLHNDIDSIGEIVQRLNKLIPNTDIRFAHGRMMEKDLENVMLDFYRRRFSILVCTTIIESGIDIPTANSIIINQTERFGLAQLHQLRGRVGRSHHRAYAYLLLGRPRASLSHDAAKRLETIEALEELGVGFSLAAQDLEIRGAGELLGEEQSGHIHEIGFTLYNQLLKHAVENLRSGKIPDMDKPLNIVTEVSFGEPAFIPEDYIYDVNIRLILYRRIAAAQDLEELISLKLEMTDRFGVLPLYAKNLFINSEIRLICQSLGIIKLEIGEERGVIEFNNEPNIDFNRLINLVKNEPTRYSFEKQKRLILQQNTENSEERIKAAKAVLTQISRETTSEKAFG